MTVAMCRLELEPETSGRRLNQISDRHCSAIQIDAVRQGGE